jgi:hypothetical protein
MERINRRARFVQWARERGLRQDWHEPDEQDITARVEGTPLDFDNAGSWPYSDDFTHAGEAHAKLHVIFSEKGAENGKAVRGRDLACVNLATLCAWATGYFGEG